MDRLGPEPAAVLGRQLLEREAEDLLERSRGERAHLVDRDRPAELARDRREAASSSPQAVIHSVNGAGSRSTFSA